MTPLRLKGAAIHKGYLDRNAQAAMAADVAAIVEAAPYYRPMTPWGKPMRVEMTSAGQLGWFTDRRGYRYVETHPDGQAWPPVPLSILKTWQALVSADRLPDCCLVNRYGADAKMGLHQDKDEAGVAVIVAGAKVSAGEQQLDQQICTCTIFCSVCRNCKLECPAL